MEFPPQASEFLIGTYRLLAFVGAVLGGFSCAFLGVMLAAGDNRRLAGVTVTLAIVASVALVVTAVMGSFLVVALSAVQPSTFADVPRGVLQSASWLTVAFDLGVVSLLLAVGVSGWLRSPLVGWISTGVMVGGLVLLGWAASLLGLGWGPLVR